jgi:sulfide:quinone oxidoreductase
VPLPGRFQPDAPLTLPKAGTFAESQAAVVAARIAAHVLGKDPSEVFAGRGYCYIETGTDAAMRGDGSFFDLPHPNMTATEPDARQAMEKRLWVEKWMKTYL